MADAHIAVKTLIAWAQRNQPDRAEASGLDPWEKPGSGPWKSLERYLRRAQGRRVVFRREGEKQPVRDVIVLREAKAPLSEEPPAQTSSAPILGAQPGLTDVEGRVARRIAEVEETLLRRVKLVEDTADTDRRQMRRELDDLRREYNQATEEIARLKKKLAALEEDGEGGMGGIVSGLTKLAGLGMAGAQPQLGAQNGQPRAWQSGPPADAVSGAGAVAGRAG